MYNSNSPCVTDDKGAKERDWVAMERESETVTAEESSGVEDGLEATAGVEGGLEATAAWSDLEAEWENWEIDLGI